MKLIHMYLGRLTIFYKYGRLNPSIIRNQDNLASFWSAQCLLTVLPFYEGFFIVPINKYIVLCEIFWNTPYLQVNVEYSKILRIFFYSADQIHSFMWNILECSIFTSKYGVFQNISHKTMYLLTQHIKKNVFTKRQTCLWRQCSSGSKICQIILITNYWWV